MKAIILAAGVNSRLKDHIDVPKTLLPLGNITILENQIEALEKAGLNRHQDILVVTGHKAEMIEKVHKNTLFNPKYAEFNNGYSVYLALSKILREAKNDTSEKNSMLEQILLMGGIMILDGDLVYQKDLISKIANQGKENILVNRRVKYSPALKDEISLVDRHNKVLEVIIPSAEYQLLPALSGERLYSFSGIMQISKETATQLQKYLKNSHEGWYTLPLPQLIKSNPFYSFEIPESLKYCFDVDTKEDLKKLSEIK